MKTLPDNPNLDHLRQQAKDLLAGLRDSEPGASLAEAQASLAEQYGFRTWTDLKAEVERRRGQADVADPALAHAVAACYGLGEVTGEMRSVARADDMGRRWSLTTERGRFAVRTMDTWYSIVDADTDVALQEAAAGAGVLLPAPVRSRAGAVVESIGGHTWRVNEWLHSGPPLSAPVSAANTYKVGGILATVHQLGLPVDRISPWHASRFSQEPWSDLAATVRARHASWAPALTGVAPVLADLESIDGSEPAAAPVLCHNSLGPNLARVGTNGRLVIVGWEHAGGQPPDWELGDALMNWTINPGGGVNAAGVRAMVDGYRSVAGSLPTMDMSMFRGAVNSLGNYVSGLVHHAMDAGDDEERRYAERSVQHLLSHLPTRAALERILGEARQSVGA